jgi:hypothetical protein
MNFFVYLYVKEFIIYTLQDPISLEIRYIGLTSQKLNVRLSAHWTTFNNKKSHKVHWIKKLKKLNQKPIIKELDIAYSLEEATALEKYWISQFKTWGFKLTNTTEGGEGALGYRHDLETIVRMKQIQALKPRKPKKTKLSKEEQYLLISQKLSKPILQYDLNGVFIKKWNSILEAAKSFGCKSSTIRHALVNNTRVSQNYFWRYYKDNFELSITVNKLTGNVSKLKVFDKLLNLTTLYESSSAAFAVTGRPTNYKKYIDTNKYFKIRFKFMAC